MKKGKINRVFSVIGAMALSSALLPCLAFSANAETEAAPVSPGLYVIAEESSMAKAALVGNDIKFTADDFARAMNLSNVKSITVTKVPPVTDGELRVGNTVVTGQQTISASEISMLTYVPSDAGLTTSSFDFRVNGSPVDITCNLYLLNKVNQCPTLGNVEENYLSVSTNSGKTVYGTLPCHDPEGDETIIEIVSYPKSGILVLNDKSTGEYSFTPLSGYTGKDEFSYVARDKYGNYSASKTVSLTVSKSEK